MRVIKGLVTVAALGALGYYTVKKGYEQWRVRRGPIGGQQPPVWPIFRERRTSAVEPVPGAMSQSQGRQQDVAEIQHGQPQNPLEPTLPPVRGEQ